MPLGKPARRSLARPFVALIASLLAAGAPASSRLEVSPQRPITVRGAISGSATADYLLPGIAGQTLSIAMSASNRSAFFDLTAPGSDAPMFIGSVDGSRFSGKLPATGDYRLRVYLMRSAARRGDGADFRIRTWVLPTR